MPEQDETVVHTPIWHSPGWMTAIVGLVGAFLTIPERVGDYLSQSQQIEEAKQTQELVLVNKTLEQTGQERVFILRYLAETADDEAAKNWAGREVNRLDELSRKLKELDEAQQHISELRAAIANKGSESEKVLQELAEANSSLASQSSELSNLERQAGLVATHQPGSIGRCIGEWLKRDTENNTRLVQNWIQANNVVDSRGRPVFPAFFWRGGEFKDEQIRFVVDQNIKCD